MNTFVEADNGPISKKFLIIKKHRKKFFMEKKNWLFKISILSISFGLMGSAAIA
ncbi:hypothetical protein RV10_GL003849 [Enterococcus pallens]|nr:hypothetical protein RV10_GL003849 [Enterococcus pallens]